MEQPNNKKQSANAFAHLILTSFLGILVCIVCLCSTTYAWFTASVEGESNKILSAGECLFSVSVYKDGKEILTTDAKNEDGVVMQEMQGSYTVTLKLPKGSGSGYLLISDGKDNYYSDYLQGDNEADQEISFTLNVESQKALRFKARWGILSGESQVKNGEKLNID